MAARADMESAPPRRILAYAPSMPNSISLAALLGDINRRTDAIGRDDAIWRDPDAALKRFLGAHSGTAESMLLVRINTAIRTRTGTFHWGDIDRLSPDGLRIVSALVDHVTGGFL